MLHSYLLFALQLAIVVSLKDMPLQEPIVPPSLVRIEGGTFEMGQEDGEGDESPVHSVTLSSFYISKYELTVKEYRAFCASKNKPMPPAPSWGWIDDHPIFNVSWNDAKEYIEWLNDALDESYRMPTEAEFAYVIREGRSSEIYPWGDKTPNENIADESLKRSGWTRDIWDDYDDGYANTSPVGSFSANALGVHDINGNVWEWVSDWYGDYHATFMTDPQGPKAGTHKVGRGASYDADPWHCRSAGRNWVGPNETIPAGFRLAKDI